MKRHLAFFVAIILGASSYGATLTVTTTADGSAGSLRNAIADAAPGDTIVFQIPTSDAGYNAGTGYWTITLTGATAANKTLVIDKDLTIDGSAQKIVVRRDNAAPTDFRVFTIPSANPRRNVTLIHLWISNGNVTTATGPIGSLPKFGGGIGNFGNLTVRDCIFTGNAAGEGGGAILNFYHIVLVRSTFSGNSATTVGGALYNAGALSDTIDTCTFTANNANEGGAIYNIQTGLFIRSSTIIGNTASGGVGTAGGGGVVSVGTAVATRFENTIIVGNTAPVGTDVSGPIISLGHNLVGSLNNNSGFGATGDQTGITAGQANLKALGNYGGLTPTMPPRVGSFALDKGKRTNDVNNQPNGTDQRGFARPVDRPESNSASGDGSDIGAVEIGVPQTGPAFTVNTTAVDSDNECTTDDCTLIEALNLTNAVADANTINFAPGVKGEINTGTVSSFGLAITQPVTINGPGSRILIINANFLGRAFNVSAPNVVISGLSILNGRRDNDNGGGILNTGGLTLNDCYIGLNGTRMSSGSGGGIYNSSNATLVLNRCTIDGNSAVEFGGGVFNDGTFTATNCSFSSNTALRGGGLISRFNGGMSSSTVRNCTITLNNANSSGAGAGDGGGGYFAEGGIQQHRVANTIIANNTNAINPDVRGNFTSDGHNLIGNVANAVGFSNNVDGDQVGTPGNVKDPLLGGAGDFGGPIDSRPLLPGSPAINAGDDALAPPTDQRGYPRVGVSDIGSFEFGSTLPTPTPTPTPTPITTLANISTRLRVETGDNVLIGGFIVTGTAPKKVMIRGIGTSLPFGDKLANPTLELHGPSGLIEANDNWVDSANKQAIIDSTIPPSNDLESAIVQTLPANNAGYTAVVRGANGGTGIGVVEAYDLDTAVDSRLANISTRGFVQTGDNVLIAGTIVVGPNSQKVIIRGIGPSLPIAGKMADPTLELRDSNGALIQANDNWVDSPNKQAIIDSTIPPSHDLESAIVATLLGNNASYTAILRGVNDTTGIAVVEVYALN